MDSSVEIIFHQRKPFFGKIKGILKILGLGFNIYCDGKRRTAKKSLFCEGALANFSITERRDEIFQ